jgi:hypothetical protein
MKTDVAFGRDMAMTTSCDLDIGITSGFLHGYTQRYRIATAANLSRSAMADILRDAEWNKKDPEFEKKLSALAFPGYLPNRGIYLLGHLENF